MSFKIKTKKAGYFYYDSNVMSISPNLTSNIVKANQEYNCVLYTSKIKNYKGWPIIVHKSADYGTYETPDIFYFMYSYQGE